MDNTTLKAQIDSQITNETTPASVSPTDVGTNMKAIIDYVDQEKRPYKCCAALIRVVSTALTVTILENGIGSIVWAGNLNNFTATLLDSFPLNKTLVLASIANTSETTTVSVNVNKTSKTASLIPFETNLEDVDSEVYVEIRVYN